MKAAGRYTAAMALRVILGRVRQKDEVLAIRIQQALDTGKDVREEQRASRGRGRRRRRRYRKHLPFTDEEALRVAFQVLKAHFYVLPMVINSANVEFAACPISGQRTLVTADADSVEWSLGKAPRDQLAGISKKIEIETETEATQMKQQTPNVPLQEYDTSRVADMGRLLDSLWELLS